MVDSQEGTGRTLVGVVSDTHGLVRPALVEALAGCDLIVHAGDVGRAEVLDALGAVAPVVAVRGNMDAGRWAQGLRPTEVVEVGEALLYVLHDLGQLGLDPAAAGLSAVISGHTHQAAIHERNGVLYLNPGSAGPARKKPPPSMALMQVEGKRVEAQVVILKK
ncbi:MAG: metallophosphoesterase family protein [Anaerolineae bacterium]|jgi:putative phosphoesterase